MYMHLGRNFLIVTDVKGFDYCAYIPYDSSKTVDKNMGEGKILPGLPFCKFRGKIDSRFNVHVHQRTNQLQYHN